MQAEIFASFIIKHNLPIASVEHAGPLFQATITKKYAFAQTKNKTPAVKKSIAHFTQNGIMPFLKKIFPNTMSYRVPIVKSKGPSIVQI